MSRLRPWLLALGLGYLALVWGLVALESMFLHERDAALRALDRQWQTQNEYARRVFSQLLERELVARQASIERALQDPLEPAQDLFYQSAEDRGLPRAIRPRPGEDTPANILADRLRASPSTDEAEGPWRERIDLLSTFRLGLAVKDREAIANGVRRILAHRSRFVVPAEQDVPFMVALLESFREQSDPDPGLMRALLRDGLSDGRGSQMPGLMRELLARRERFTQRDLERLADRIAALAEASGVSYSDFLDRVHETERLTPAVSLGKRPPEVDGRLEWYFEPGDRVLLGFRFDAAEMIERVAAEMRRPGLISDQDHFQWRSAGSDSAPIRADKLPIELSLPVEMRIRQPEIRMAFLLKTGLLISCGLFGLALLGVAVGYQFRKQRFLDLKSDFVATVSHELRTPLASIRLLAETLERRVSENDRAKDYPARIVSEIDGMSFLIENILSFNRLDKGRWIARTEAVSLRELLSSVERELAFHTAKPLRMQVEGADAIVEADPELMKLLFMNLGRNACLYNERDPVELAIELRSDSGRVDVLVSDNGVGIPKSEWGRIFEDFYRPEVSSNRKKRGSGLGLALCQRIMEIHRGRIQVERSGPDGTSFALHFPPEA